ncbi:HutD family protein [Kribbella sp. NPDC056951]|uniref:HutD/Ves family protein n=1 Tax=Kribbella sp. NPDC056951 TaxID=3345978 RepID=UPI003633E104
MGLRVLRHADYRRVEWKNGRGLTYEMARSEVAQSDVARPEVAGSEGAAFDGADFDWRLSFAAVERPGPFSTFPGVDRIITLASGAQLTLEMADGEVQVLRRFEPFAFPGEAEVRGVPSGPTMNLNVMTRRGRAAATVVCHRIADRALVDLRGAAFLVVMDGIVMVNDVVLAPRDAVGELPDRLTVTGNGVVAVVSIS